MVKKRRRKKRDSKIGRMNIEERSGKIPNHYPKNHKKHLERRSDSKPISQE